MAKARSDIVTGWNVKGFDVLYLVNRIRRMFGDYKVELLSHGE